MEPFGRGVDAGPTDGAELVEVIRAWDAGLRAKALEASPRICKKCLLDDGFIMVLFTDIRELLKVSFICEQRKFQ